MRAIVVVGRDGELAVALRERLDRARVTVLDGSDDPLATVGSCLPWPWMLVGAVPELPTDLVALVHRRPVLLRWLGHPPTGMPPRCRVLERFVDLVASVDDAVHGRVGTVGLAPGTGVAIDGVVHVSAELEALLGEWPQALDLPRSRFRHAESVLDRAAPSLRIVATVSGSRLEAT